MRQAIIVERIAGEQHDIGADRARGGQDAGKPRRAVAAVEARGVVVIDVQIGAVDDDDIARRR